MITPQPSVTEPAPAMAPSAMKWTVVARKATVWALFLFLLYLAADFFFTAFMTFMFSYASLALVELGMKLLSSGVERRWVRVLLTLAVFVVLPMLLAGLGLLVAPQLVAQGQHMAGWISQLDPAAEVAHLLEGRVGPSEFARVYGGPDDARYQKALQEFRQSSESHVAEYNQFPRLEAWVEGGFGKQFVDAESGRIRARLMREGTSSQQFADWFLKVKVPRLQEAARSLAAAKPPQPPPSPLVVAAATATPEQLLHQARRASDLQAPLRDEWIKDTLDRGLTAARASPSYREQLRADYERRRLESPEALPYTYDEYVELQRVRPQGRVAFGQALERLRPTAADQRLDRLQADFAAAKKHELFLEWWGGSSTARFIRHQLESNLSSQTESRAERMLASLLNMPVDLSTALLLSFFICIDFPTLQRGARALRGTWLRNLCDDLLEPLANLGQLLGRAIQAQALIALCNAVLMFVALKLLGVAYPALLALAVFILCQVPTLGMCLSLAMLVAVSLLQPGGGEALTLKVMGAVLVVILLETFVFSPRILGRMMELHPILLMALLPLAQYFFGIWGLLLATPVAVYVIHVLILRQGLPGSEAAHDTRQASSAVAGPLATRSEDSKTRQTV